MTMSTPRTRPWSPSRIPRRLLLVGLAAIVVLAGAVIAVGNPFSSNQQAVTYQTAAASQGTLKVTVAATGPITNETSVPLTGMAVSGDLRPRRRAGASVTVKERGSHSAIVVR